MAVTDVEGVYTQGHIESDLEFVRGATAKMRWHDERQTQIADERAVVIRRLRERSAEATENGRPLSVQAIADACGVSRMAVDATLRARKPKATKKAAGG